MPDSFLDDRLHELTTAAVLAAAARVHLYLATGNRPLTEVAPSIGAHDSGWPNVVKPWWTAPEDESRFDVLTSYSGHATNIAMEWDVEDAPEVQALTEYIAGSAELLERLVPTINGTPLSGKVSTHVEHWVLQILDRAWNLDLVPKPKANEGGPLLIHREDVPQFIETATAAIVAGVDATGLDEVYREKEQALLALELPVEYWVPLVLTPLSSHQPVRLDGRCRIEPLTEPIQMARARIDVEVLAGSPLALRLAATHALVVTGKPWANSGPGPRLVAPGSADDVDYEAIDLACEALRIACDNHVGYAEVLIRPVGWADTWTGNLPTMMLHGPRRRYDPSLDHYGWLSSGPHEVSDDLLAATPEVLDALKSAGPRARLASRRLSAAVLREDDDDRTVDLCIGLEALLSDGGTGELTFKMSLRGAVALATRPEDPLESATVKKLLAAVYKHRSAVVHGNPGVHKTRTYTEKDEHGKDITSIPISVVAESLLRALLRDALMRGWTAESLDDSLLKMLDVTQKMS